LWLTSAPMSPQRSNPRSVRARTDSLSGLGRSEEDPARLSVVIEAFEHDGRGKGRHHDRAVLLPQAYPGEAVAFRVDVPTRGALQGRVLKVLRPSQDRVAHPCSHEFHCTGCPLLSYRPEAEARFKTGLVRRALTGVSAVGGDPIRPMLTAKTPFGYRHFGKQHFTRSGGRVVLGSFVQGTHRVADNRGCPVLAPALARVFDRLADLVHASGTAMHVAGADRGLRHAVARLSRATGRVQLVLATSEPAGAEAEKFLKTAASALPDVESAFVLVQEGEGNVLLEGEVRSVFGPPRLEERLLGRTYAVGPRSFFQVNPWGAETIFSTAVDLAGKGELALELYSGVGALTLPLAAAFRRVVAAEASDEATLCARENAERNDVRNVEFVAGRADETAARILERETPDVVVADPPRKGLGEELAGKLARSAARAIILLSCDPQALGRDAAALIAGGRRLAVVQPVDQFPRTAHVETVSRFE
jgi:23S rRNA (uracil1939-C5)-methyltransferase